MSDTYHYADGAVHNDHKRVVNISGAEVKDLQGLLKSFLSDEAEEVEAVSTDKLPPVEEPAPRKRPVGRSSEALFEEEKQGLVTLFTDFLKEHHRFSTEVDTRKGNYVNKAFAAFYVQWIKDCLVPVQPNGNACYRFLKGDCGLSMKPDMKTYANFIRAYIIDADKRSLDDVTLAVEKFLLRKKRN